MISFSRNPCFARSASTPRGRQEITRKLDGAPWLWPDEALHPDAYSRAHEAMGSRPALRAGEVALVTVREGVGSLWSFRVKAFDEPITIGAEGVQAWRDVLTALPRSLPFLWKAFADYKFWSPRARALYDETRTTTITGPSLGLAMGLALASSILEIPLPGDFVATATCNERGFLGRVDGLEAKLRVIGEVAPGARRVFVAKIQRDEAARLCEELGLEHLEVRGFERLGEVIEEAIEDLEEVWVRGDESRADQELKAEALFRLSIGERDAAIAWRAVARAADHALEAWGGSLDEKFQGMLEFASAVSNRHHTNRGSLSSPRQTWLAHLQKPTRIQVLAHVVQQAADTNTPDPEELFRLAHHYLPEHLYANLERATRELSNPQLELLGALARLYYAARGDLARAISLQKQIARAWCMRWQYNAMSYPISALYRLCAISAESPDLQDKKSTREASQLYEEILALEEMMARGGRREVESPYIIVARASASLSLGRMEACLEALEELEDRPNLDDNIRAQTRRWMLANSIIYNDPVRRACVRERLEESGRAIGRELDLVLVDLRDAARARDRARCARSLERFEEVQPGLDAMLRAHPSAPAPTDVVETARFLSARYPY